MDKVFKVADVKKLERQVSKGEISYSKMVQEMNYMAVVYFNTNYTIKKLENLKK